MREIKFRVWDVKNDRMVFFNAYEKWGFIDHTKSNVSLSQGGDSLHLSTNPELYIWMQFTGLTDKNGIDIYEGDILRYMSQNPKHKGKYFNNLVDFASGNNLVGWRMRNKSAVVRATPYKFSVSEIIGNIHSNPELL